MSSLDHYDYQELHVARDGSLVEPDEVEGVAAAAGRATDVLVLSHGWNNDMAEAKALYGRIAGSLDAAGADDDRDIRLAVVGVLWPSKRFADKDLISGGAAAGGGTDDSLGQDVLALVGAFRGDADAEAAIKEAAHLAPDLEHSADARRQYADLLRSLVTREQSESADAMDQFFDLDGDELMQRVEQAGFDMLTELPPEPSDSGDGGAQGFLGGLASKGRMLLNMVTYYEMKNRAGAIGVGTVAPVLAEHVVGRARLHLAGHSFGGRLVTAAASGQQKGAVASMSLLQAAFSHNAFAKDWKPGRDGAYRAVVSSGIVSGPVVISHTRNDKAVGVAYAMASRIAGQQDSGIGDASSPFGGLGSNGAQHTPEARDDQDLGAAGTAYDLEPRTVHNLLADDFVSGHGDVSNPAVIGAVWQAVRIGAS